MIGPMDRLFGNTAFDLDRDGKIDAAEWAYINDTVFSEDNDSSDDCDSDFGDDF